MPFVTPAWMTSLWRRSEAPTDRAIAEPRAALMALGLFHLLALLVAPPTMRASPSSSRCRCRVSRPQAAPAQPRPMRRRHRPHAAAPPPSPVPAAQSTVRWCCPSPSVTPPTPEVPQETYRSWRRSNPSPTRRNRSPNRSRLPSPSRRHSRPSPRRRTRRPRASEAASVDQAADSESSQAPSQEVGSPQPTERVPPEYPSRAQRRGIEGYVEVRFTIQPDGRVDADSLRVTEAQPRNVFERAALKAISGWRFPRADAPREARQRLEFRLKR